MSFDSTCRRLAEQFPEDFASWLLDRPIDMAVLDPTELSLEPIRADSLILLKGSSEILHVEFQTDPKKDMPMRLADYRLRIHRKFPEHTIQQVVLYLRKTNSEMVLQDYFEIAGMYAEYRVIRIWEVPVPELLSHPGLLPFVALGKTADPAQALRDAVRVMGLLPEESKQHETLGAAYVLSGLILEAEVISQIIRRDLMQESVTYQAILEEGREEGRQKGLQEGLQEGLRRSQRSTAINLLREGASIELIVKVLGLSIEEIDRLKQENDL
jgi:predicted transposase/invertase (TIGR01784 family)